MVAALGPGVGEQQEDAPDAGIAEVGDEFARIAIMHANVGNALLVNVAEQLGDAVNVGLAADEADVRMGRGLPGKVLAAAEADLQPDILDVAEQALRLLERAHARLDAQSGEQVLDQPRLAGAQRRTLAPAIELAPVLGVVIGRDQVRARLSSPERSTRSQEKPPSASGGRPKWP